MSEKVNDPYYLCASCGNMFEKDWTDEEAIADFNNDFPGYSKDDTVIVCDDCYQRILRQYREAN